MDEKKTEQMVKIKLPLDREHRDDVFVSVNERNWVIKRGVDVVVPACVAEVLRHQEEMMLVIMDFEEKNAARE